MIILIQPGQKLIVGFADADNRLVDGEFEVHFDTKEHPRRILVKETAGLPGSVLGKAKQVLYEEKFSKPERKLAKPGTHIIHEGL